MFGPEDWEVMKEMARLVVTWTFMMGLLGVALTVVISSCMQHSDRKRNWHKGTHDYYGNELPKSVRDLIDD